MVQKFGSWTAFLVGRSLVQYWVWGKPIRLIMDDIVPAGTTDLMRRLLHEACPVFSVCDVVLNYMSFLVVPISWLISKIFPRAPVLDISICLRKRYFHDKVVEAIENGARQVLILGGGYDVLMINLAPRYPNVLFVEVDHPSTSIFKRAAVDKLGYKYPNAHFFPLDLSIWKLEDKIVEECPGWNRDVKSVVTAEGLFPYLTPEAVRQCLRSLKAITAMGSTLVFTYCTQSGLDGFLGNVFGKTMLSAFGEPILWVPGSADEVVSLISSEGFHIDISPKQGNHYQLYLANYRQLRCHRLYQNMHGISISK